MVKISVACGLSILLLFSCSVGSRHAPDSAMEQNFLNHESAFTALLTAMEGDPKLTMIGANELRYGGVTVRVKDGDLSVLDQVGFPREAWQRYQKQLRELGLEGGVLKNGARVEFRAEQGSLRNGDSYKGYEYSVETLQPLKPGLDGYRKSDGDRSEFGGWLVHKHLKDHWYLYLFVNG